MNQPVIDAHLHLWDPGALDYPWLAGEPVINRPFLPGHYREAAAGVPVQKMVFVQCECRPEQAMEELDWISGVAAGEPALAAAVSFAPLEQGARVRPVLERMSENPLVRGVRRIIEFEPDAEFCLRPGFIEGVRLLGDFDWSFDININDTQIENTLRFVKACPHVRFMLDHAAKPNIAGGDFKRWAAGIRELSRNEGMYCKLSHLVNKAPRGWKPADLRPYADHVLACFGPDRVCFAGDFPVCNVTSSWAEWFGAAEELTAGWTRSERQRFFHDNAARFYSLQDELAGGDQ